MSKKRTMTVLTAVFVAMSTLFGGTFCLTVLGQSDANLSSPRTKRIAVMPFLRGKYGGSITQNLDCKVCQFVYDTDALDPYADHVLSRIVHEEIEKKHGDKVVPYKRSSEVYDRIPKDDLSDTLLSLAQKLAPALNADLIVAGNVWRYRDRVGGSRAVQSPASVAFAVYLIDASSGNLLWQSVFAETQKSLFENVLEARTFFDTGGKWLTANEPAQYGVSRLLKESPLE